MTEHHWYVKLITGSNNWLQSGSNNLQRRRWHPTLVLLPGKSHGWRSLVGCSPWGCEESDTTEQLPFHFSLSCIGEGNGNPVQCICLENPWDGGAWWAAVYGVAQSWTRLKQLSSSSNNTHTQNLEKWFWRIYLQGSNGETDIENRLMDMGWGEERVRCMERVTWRPTLPYVKQIASESLLYGSGNANRDSVST